MRRCCIVAAISAFALIGMPQASHGAIITYRATLNGPSESPVNASPGTGTAQVVYDNVAHTAVLTFNYTGLTGNSTAAHIHSATTTPFTGTSGVATSTFSGIVFGTASANYVGPTVDLNLAAGTANSFFNTGFTEASLFSSIATGTAYFNIHSSTFGGGEIRGFLVAVPEPSSMLLSGLAVFGLGVAVRYRRKRKIAQV